MQHELITTFDIEGKLLKAKCSCGKELTPDYGWCVRVIPDMEDYIEVQISYTKHLKEIIGDKIVC